MTTSDVLYRRDDLIMACDYGAADSIAVGVIARVRLDGTIDILDVLTAEELRRPRHDVQVGELSNDPVQHGRARPV